MLISNQVNIWREVQQDGAGIVANDDLDGTRSLLTAWATLSDEQKSRMSESARDCFNRRFEIHKSAESLIRVLSGGVRYHELPLCESTGVPAN